MKFFRRERLSSLIKEELSKLIVKELEFDALVTLTQVNIAQDLETAIVHFSAYPSGKSDETLKVLNKNKGNLYHQLVKKLKMRRVPDILFKVDRGLERAANIEKSLLEAENKAR